VQLSFCGYAPKGTSKVTVAGKALQCPVDSRVSQIVRFTMPTSTGSKKTVTLDDGTQLTITASRK
jgi:ferric-dicitrate binding protein FerR (iron transport regulator)